MRAGRAGLPRGTLAVRKGDIAKTQRSGRVTDLNADLSPRFEATHGLLAVLHGRIAARTNMEAQPLRFHHLFLQMLVDIIGEDDLPLSGHWKGGKPCILEW